MFFFFKLPTSHTSTAIIEKCHTSLLERTTTISKLINQLVHIKMEYY